MSKGTKLALGSIIGFLAILTVFIGGIKTDFWKGQTTGPIPEKTKLQRTESPSKGASFQHETSSRLDTEKSQPAFPAGKPDQPQPAAPINIAAIEASPPLTGTLSDSEFEKKLVTILNKKPEIIIEALQKFNQSQQRAQQEKLEASLKKYQGEISKESSAVVLGKKEADVKLVVFLDPNCPHCRPFSIALNKVRENFPNVTILLRHWAILGPDSEDVVRGLWAIHQQGEDKFNAAVKAIASSDERYTFAKLLAWVEDHRLDTKKFKEDAGTQATKNVLEETKNLAMNIGLEGTPTSVLIDKKGIRFVSPTDEQSLQAILTEASTEAPKVGEAMEPSKTAEAPKV